MKRNDITAIILTKNEEVNIERCMNSILGIVDRIVVVDSGSSDKTVELAKNLGAEIYVHPFEHYASQFNWALDHTSIDTKWVYRIDADECVTDELAAEIKEQCALHHDDDVTAFTMKHKICFLGKYLRYGGAYPFIKITIFKPEFARFENRAMGEHVVPSQGRCLALNHDCIHYDFKSLYAFVDKHNGYAVREVKDYYERVHSLEDQAKLYSEAERAKKSRDLLYYRLPMFLRAKLYYWYKYYIKMGFLDGRPGKIYAYLQSYWYRYLVDAMIYEKELLKK